MKLRILSVNPDSLYLSVKGDLTPTFSEMLPAAKQQAQENDEDLVRLFYDNRVAGGSFYVSRRGASRDYPYVLQNARFRLHISRRGGCRPVALVQIRADLLYEYDLRAINTMLLRLLGGMLVEGYSMQVARVDLACDFQAAEGGEWKFPHWDDVASRTRKDSMYREHGKISGMTFGRHQGTLQVQLYRKSETLIADKKQWMFDVWRAEREDFDPETPVYRVEIRFYRDALRLLKDNDGYSLNTLWDLYSSLADLAAYAITGEKPYFRVKDPDHVDSNEDRRRNAPWWTQVRDAFATFEGSQARKRINDELRFHYLSAIKRAESHLARAAAICRLAGWHPAVNPAKFAADCMRAFYAEDPLEWAERVNEKSQQLRSVISGAVLA